MSIANPHPWVDAGPPEALKRNPPTDVMPKRVRHSSLAIG